MSTALEQTPNQTWASGAHRRTIYLVLAIVGISILFDGYDLVVYGAVLSTLLDDPSHIGELSPAVAGTLGSWAMIGVMIGALGAGAVGDRLGRRKVMIVAIIWFSLGMAATAMSTSIFAFGALRFVTGLGVGVIVATGGAVIAEFAPANRKNLFNAIVYSGVPAGGVMASLLALVLEDAIGWRGLFMIGASPLLFLLPLALVALPESPRWLMSRGRADEAASTCERFGLPKAQFMSEPVAALKEETNSKQAADLNKSGFAGIFSRSYLPGTILIGTMSFIGLLSTYGLNTWLPKIMQANGASAHDSLYSLLALNGGAVLGGLFASWIADKIGAKAVITSTFGLAALSLAILPQFNTVAPMYLPIALAGIGVLGTQVLTYGLTSNYFGTASRAAGVAWCAGFGRLGGIVGPLVGGLILGAGLGPTYAFYIFAGAALIGAICTAIIPRSPAAATIVSSSEALTQEERAQALAEAKAVAG
ncbi:aromatic acid/H+ symport family MFS transporter [Corynebacterium breve]|uniref:Aromatic acid/H+ symport family MFS transporter n=1 Tax=Corynebacterium breve TaxID=3049799 RepID=A0ABY8VDM9_9CORY|nr:aromatic acid/H+ symport family MFS transporter [Corynebacterium breve]WIM67771.1 aromatic acid/H+ symport family MFS transporter [Corynebacterium breve]